MSGDAQSMFSPSPEAQIMKSDKLQQKQQPHEGRQIQLRGDE
jgi:hypothetical protein